MIKCLFYFLLILGNVGFTQTVLVGKIPYAADSRVKILSAVDHISGKKALLTSVNTDSLGNFTASFEQHSTGYIEVVSDFYKAGLYTMPGSTYRITFLKADSSEVKTLGREIPVALDIATTFKDSINDGIRDVNAVLDSFFSRNYELFIRKAAKPVVDKFKPLMSRRFVSAHPLVKTYLKYAFAPIDEAVFRDRSYMFNEYFSGTVLYENKEYMDYFNQFFIRYLEVQSIGKCEQDYNTALNTTRSFDGLLSVMQRCDTLIRNDSLRRLVLLKGLRELYDHPKYKKENIRVILEKHSAGTNTYTAGIAKNILEEVTYLKQGTSASLAGFVDLNGKEITADKLKGKFVYLFFWASWCDPCMQELKLLQSLKGRYDRKIVFIGVNMDKDISVLQRTLKRNKFDWITVHDKDGLIAHTYRVKALPQFFMLDRDGDFLETPPMPGQNLRGYLEEVTRKK